jgi:WD40 repeat protein
LLSDFETREKTSDPRSWEWYFVRGLVDLSESSSLEIKHSNAITCLVPLPGGRTSHFVTATSNGEISLWEAPTGKGTPITDPDTSITGVGISYEPDVTSRSTKITEIFPGGPAEKDGRLRVGDTILKIAKPDGSTVEVSSVSVEQLDELTAGPVGSKFQVEVRHADNSIESIELVRATFSIKGRHSAAIVSLAASQDGRRLASIDAEQWFSLWDLSEPTHPKILRRVQLFPTSFIAFSPSGDYLVAANGRFAEFIPLGNAASGTPIDAGGEISSLNFSPYDGHLGIGTAAAGAAEEQGALKLWDIESKKDVWSYPGNCLGLSFSKDAGNLAVLVNGLVMLFSRDMLASTPSDLKPLQVNGDLPYQSAAIALNRQGTYVAAGGSDGVVRVWKASDGSRTTSLAGHRAPVLSVAFDESGQYLASVGRDRTLRIWNLRHWPPAKVRRVALNGAYNVGIAYSWDGTFIATADPYSGNDIAMTDSGTGSKTQDKSGLVSILDSVSGQTLRTIPGAIWRLGFARDIPLLPVPDVDGTIRLIDVRDGSKFQVLRGHKGKVKQAVFSPDGTKLLSGGMDGTVLLWDVTQGTYEMLKDFGEQIRAVAISPKGDLAACAALDEVALFNLKSRQIVGELGPVNTAYLASLEFSPDGALLVLGELDGRIRTWNMTNQKEGRPFSGHTGPVWSLAFSPDSRRLLSSGTDRKTFLWDVESRRELLVLEDAESIYGGTFSADGSRVALTSGSQALLYDAALFSRRQEAKWFYPARAHYRADLKQWQPAIRDLSEAINQGEGDLMLRKKRGEAYAEVGDFDRAIEDFQAALGSDLTEPTVRVLLCDALLARGGPGDRETYYKHLRTLIEGARKNGTPESVNVAAWYASLLPDLPADIDLTALIALLRDKAVAIQPQRYEFLGTYGTLLYRAGDIAGAREALNRAMSLYPRDTGPGGTPFDWVILSMCCWQLNEQPLARKWLDETEDYLKKVKEDPFFYDPFWGWTWDQIAEMKQLLSEAHDFLRGKDQSAK